MHSQDCHRGIDGLIGVWQIFGRRLDNRRRVVRALCDHHVGRLHRQHPAI